MVRLAIKMKKNIYILDKFDLLNSVNIEILGIIRTEKDNESKNASKN